ncbi:uncharacterized protein KGF55_003749 [Candida pseudojiufengensis]|uniref:uncharacterized protein n=1 Tax=Candida pseudojiufengensis TaxID=497109 RepID=UPI0022242932|nr:uncharacterized protein KGF55_003749 [Candida pseudojiufengensis]KAI5962673.1 hypothetical protein KGF55_003749 [Candida pseudojiufengensis]
MFRSLSRTVPKLIKQNHNYNLTKNVLSHNQIKSNILSSSSSSLFITKRSLFIQTSETPNEQALKFLPSMPILGENETIEFLSGREAHSSPLAIKLFSIDGIKTIMFGSNFITIEKSSDYDWSILKPEIFSILTEFLNNGEPIINNENNENELTDDLKIDDDDDEVISMIKELIFTRIRPAIQDDGGDIEFIKFDENTGTVYLKLKGACRSCDSSSVTLKNGIESMLKHYIEEVEAVEPIDEMEEEQPVTNFESKVLPRKRVDETIPDAPPTL